MELRVADGLDAAGAAADDAVLAAAAAIRRELAREGAAAGERGRRRLGDVARHVLRRRVLHLLGRVLHLLGRHLLGRHRLLRRVPHLLGRDGRTRNRRRRVSRPVLDDRRRVVADERLGVLLHDSASLPSAATARSNEARGLLVLRARYEGGMCYFNGKRFARRGEALGMKKRWTRSMRCVEGEGLRGARGAGVGGMAAARGGCSRVLGIYLPRSATATPT